MIKKFKKAPIFIKLIYTKIDEHFNFLLLFEKIIALKLQNTAISKARYNG